jgi:hypothetical protein
MSNFLVAVLPLVGVVVGVVATGVLEGIRWRRGQAVRWDERRLDAYAEYGRVIKKIHGTALGIVDPHIVNLAEPINREAGLETIAEAEAYRTDVWELMLLLADQATERAAVRWLNAVTREVRFAISRPNDAGSGDWIAAVKSADGARDDFYEAARKSVNVGGGSVAIAQFLPSAQRKWADSGQDTRTALPGAREL